MNRTYHLIVLTGEKADTMETPDAEQNRELTRGPVAAAAAQRPFIVGPGNRIAIEVLTRRGVPFIIQSPTADDAAPNPVSSERTLAASAPPAAGTTTVVANTTVATATTAAATATTVAATATTATAATTDMVSALTRWLASAGNTEYGDNVHAIRVRWTGYEHKTLYALMIQRARPETALALFVLATLISAHEVICLLWSKYESECRKGLQIALWHAWRLEDMKMMDWLASLMPEDKAFWSVTTATLAHAWNDACCADKHMARALHTMQAHTHVMVQGGLGTRSATFDPEIMEELGEAFCWTYRKRAVATRRWLTEQLRPLFVVTEPWLLCVLKTALLRQELADIRRIVTENEVPKNMIRRLLVDITVDSVLGQHTGLEHVPLDQELGELNRRYLYDQKTNTLLPAVRESILEMMADKKYAYDSGLVLNAFGLDEADKYCVAARLIVKELARVVDKAERAEKFATLYTNAPVGTGVLRAEDCLLLRMAFATENVVLAHMFMETAFLPTEGALVVKKRGLLQAASATGKIELVDWLLNTYYTVEDKQRAVPDILGWWPEPARREQIREYITMTHLTC